MISTVILSISLNVILSVSLNVILSKAKDLVIQILHFVQYDNLKVFNMTNEKCSV